MKSVLIAIATGLVVAACQVDASGENDGADGASPNTRSTCEQLEPTCQYCTLPDLKETCQTAVRAREEGACRDVLDDKNVQADCVPKGSGSSSGGASSGSSSGGSSSGGASSSGGSSGAGAGLDLGSCTGGSCVQTCALGQRCSADCAGGGCTQSCSEGATCDFSCSGGGCTQGCAEGSDCTISCSGGACGQSCSGDCERSCSGGDCG